MPPSATAVRSATAHAAAVAASLSVLLAAGCSGGGGRDRAQDPAAGTTSTASAAASGTSRASAPTGSSSTPGTTSSPGTTNPVPPLGKELTGQKPAWKTCPAPSEAEGGGAAPPPPPGGSAWECATVKAPLDYADPGGKTFDLALIRARATDPQKRIGSLIFNFGGPGGSGITTLPAAATDYTALNTRYDLVSFDPRGVGRSVPVRCEDDKQLDAFYSLDATPDTDAEITAYSDGLKSYASACKQHSGGALPHVGTLNAARDLDLMRQVLGDDKLYYFGISYGTELGGVYAHLFPKNVGRAVFDAVVDPTKNSEEGSLGQAKGFQLALDNFAQDCVDRGDQCLIAGTTRAEVEGQITDLLKRLDARPVPAGGGRELTQTQALNGIAQSLYSQQFWPLLEQGVDEADGGDGSLLLALSDAMNGRNQDGRYDNMGAAFNAISCVDTKDRYSVAQTRAKLPEFRAASPVFGDYLGWGMLGCTNWPVPGTWEHPDVSAPGAAPVVVIGNTGDPATPYEGARAMVEALGPGVGVEITYRGQGHGAYNATSTCVKGAVDAYLLEGRVPAAGTVCQ
ncbi:alpha/beta hydrolase [Streptomyces tsukubensis]|uniref:alpha/beta hydrolase n=1 Tax=Streptomyces tsukubensis TaxID=83656 RepID=UPI00344F6194